MRAHIIRDGRVVNTIEVGSLSDFPNAIDASIGGSIGDLWDGHTCAPPPKWASVADGQVAITAASDAKAKAVRDKITAGISAAEMASWPIKRGEALAYQAKGVLAVDADAPMLTLEATARGITTAALVLKVMAKATMLSTLEAAIAGRNGALNDAAAAAATLGDLNAIDTEGGWPA
ncbi:MAG: hypothetical protein NT159_01450 [Proteobacteria bacterium]|nr:hypothetical protein [Pseudomonadota bacterium]